MTIPENAVDTKLLPCPFCNGEAEMWDGMGTQAEVTCTECGVQRGIQVSDILEYEERYAEDNGFNMNTLRYPPNILDKAKQHLAELWNTRSTPPADVQGLVDALEHFADTQNSPLAQEALAAFRAKQEMV